MSRAIAPSRGRQAAGGKSYHWRIPTLLRTSAPKKVNKSTLGRHQLRREGSNLKIWRKWEPGRRRTNPVRARSPICIGGPLQDYVVLPPSFRSNRRFNRGLHLRRSSPAWAERQDRKHGTVKDAAYPGR